MSQSKIPNAGYGVFAGKDFKKGEIVERAPFLEVETPYGNEIMNYVFQSHLNRNKSLIVFGFGSIYNHTKTPNLVYSINPRLPSDRLFTYTASKDIKKGDELYINYGDTHPVNEMFKRKSSKNTRKSKPKTTVMKKPKSSRNK